MLTSSTATKIGSTTKAGATIPTLQAGLEPGAVLRPESDQPPRCLPDRPGAVRGRISGKASRAARTTTWRCTRWSTHIRIGSATSLTSSITGGRYPDRRRSVSTRSHAHDAARRAVQEHCARTGLQALCEPAPNVPYHQRIRYSLPHPPPHVTIIVPTKDRVDFLSRCVGSVVSRSTYKAFDIVIVDNGSIEAESKSYFEQVQRQPCVSVLHVDEPFNFSRLNNLAASARGELLCFLNNDTEIISPAGSKRWSASRCGRRRGRRRDALLSRRHHPARGCRPRNGRNRLCTRTGTFLAACRVTSGGRGSRRRWAP